MNPSTTIGIFMIGFGVGFIIATKYWSSLVDRSLEQIARVLADNRELLETWEPNMQKIQTHEEIKRIKAMAGKV